MLKDNQRDVNFISGFKDSLVKSYAQSMSDPNDDRIEVLYEAYIDQTDGQECQATAFIYDGNSSNILYTIELKAKWKEEWDTAINASGVLSRVNGASI